MTLTFRPDVHAAVLGEDIVLLDVRSDAYVCLPAAAPALRPSADLRRLHPLDPSDGSSLLDRGLVEAVGPAPRVPTPPPPTKAHCGLPAGPAPSLTLAERARLIMAMSDLVRHYYGRSLRHILSHVEAAAPPFAALADPHRALRLARQFHRHAVWLPLPRKCLIRSYVLLRFLQRSGCRADWVFGVRTWPFGAHCWLQLDDVVLDEAPDRLAAWTPILAVHG